MARLRTLRPSLGALPSRLPSPRLVAERQRLKERDENVDWHSWYKTDAWRALRLKVLDQAGWRCERTGLALDGRYPAANSPVVDHRIPHRGDEKLFWDRANLQAVTKQWHDSTKQARERAHQRAATHPDWIEPATCELTIVCGPPAGGKSTYVAAARAEHDVVIDLDECAACVSGHVGQDWDRERWLQAALFLRNERLGELSRMPPRRRAWFIVGEPLAAKREWWARKLSPRRVVVLETPAALCMARAAGATDRSQTAVYDAASRWWAAYQRRPGEVVVAPA